MQQDFGGFDPRFLGVSVKIASEENWTLLRNALSGGRQPTADEVLRAPRAGAFEILSVSTVLSHETRHFHDFLISPFGSEVFRSRIMAFVNAFQALGFVLDRCRQEGANCVPVPVPEWCWKTPAERENSLARWNDFVTQQGYAALVIPTLPHLPKELSAEGLRTGALPQDDLTFTRLLVGVNLGYQKLAKLLKSPPGAPDSPSYQLFHIAELSAVLVQIEEIFTAFGGECTNLFLETLVENVQAPYASALTLLNVLSPRSDEPPDSNFAAAIVTWSLLGDYQRDGLEASPTVRFASLVQRLRRSATPDHRLGLRSLFERWDRDLGLSPTLQGVADSLEVDDKFLAQLEAARRIAAAENPAAAAVFERAIALWQMFSEARTDTVRRFLDEPETYTHPRTYLEMLSTLSVPPLQLGFIGSGLVMHRREVRDRGYLVYRGIRRQTEDEVLVMSFSPPVFPSGLHHIDRAKAFDHSVELALTDFLFSTLGRDLDEQEEAVVRDEMAKEGLRLVSVF